MRGILLMVALAACACGKAEDAPGAAGDAATGASPGDAAADGCGEAPDGSPPGATCVIEANGKVEDLSGAGLPNLTMTFCGSQCYGAPSSDAGSYVIPIGAFLPTQNYAVHADGRPDHAVDYYRLSAGEPPVVNVTMHLPTLPPSTMLLPPDNSPTASSVTEGDLTLQIPAGTSFNLDVEDFGTTAGRTLRVASVPLASAPPYAAAANVDAIYALAPSGATPHASDDAGVPLGVVLKNSAGLPAGAAVEFLVLGDDYFSEPPNVGQLAVQATGHVSADGQTIQTDPGEGIDELTWLAVRKAN